MTINAALKTIDLEYSYLAYAAKYSTKAFDFLTCDMIDEACDAICTATSAADDWSWSDAHWSWLCESNLSCADIESINHFPTWNDGAENYANLAWDWNF